MRFDRLSDADSIRELAAHREFSATIAAHAQFPIVLLDNQADGQVGAVARNVVKLIETLLTPSAARN
jgi:hypothetical protein